MERKPFQIVAGLTWLALPLTALNYWRAWDRLPMRVAVHFDVNWQPNGWTSRGGALMLALGTTTFLLVIFTVAFDVIRNAAISSLSRWAVVAVFCIVLGFVYFVNNWIVDRNLKGQQPARLGEWMVPRNLDAASTQELKPAIVVIASGAAGSRTPSKRSF